MKNILPGNRLTRILLIICMILACIVAAEWYLMQSGVSDARRDAEQEVKENSTLAIAEYSAPGIKLFDEILDRPLFVQGREPPEETDNSPATPVARKPVHFNLLLEGVAITPEARVAVVREINTRKLLRLAEGTEHGGWKLEQVSETGAKFTNDQQVHELTLEIDTKTRKARPPGKARGITPNVAGKHVTVDQIRLKKPTPPRAPQSQTTVEQTQQEKLLQPDVSPDKATGEEPTQSVGSPGQLTIDQILKRMSTPPATSPGQTSADQTQENSAPATMSPQLIPAP